MFVEQIRELMEEECLQDMEVEFRCRHVKAVLSLTSSSGKLSKLQTFLFDFIILDGLYKFLVRSDLSIIGANLQC